MADDYDQALAKSLRLLARRERFEAEIRARLGEFPEEVVNSVVAHLKKRKLLSDERAAHELAYARHGRRAVSREALVTELRSRGASSDTISKLPQTSDFDLAIECLRSRYARISFDRGKAARALQRRGFAEEDIEMALDRFESAEVE